MAKVEEVEEVLDLIVCCLCSCCLYSEAELEDHIEKDHSDIFVKNDDHDEVRIKQELDDESEIKDEDLIKIEPPSKHSGNVAILTSRNENAGRRKCDFCDFATTERRYFRRHIYTMHADELSTVCQKCDKKFYDDYDLKIHQIREHGKKICQCPICNQQFGRILNLNRHMKLVHKDLNVFSCLFCNENFHSEKTLQLHSSR